MAKRRITHHDPVRLAAHIGTRRLHSVRYTGYGDAGGNDKWDMSEQWYVVVLSWVRSSHRWKQYCAWHKTIGKIHLSARGLGYIERNEIIRKTFTIMPFDYATVLLIDTKSYTASLVATGKPLCEHFPAWYAWRQLSGSMAGISLILRDMGGTAHNPVSRFVINHPGAGAVGERAITALTRDFWRLRVPIEYRTGGDPGIDLADVIAWTFRRSLTKPDDVLPPEPFQLMTSHLQVLVVRDHLAAPFHITSLGDLHRTKPLDS